MSGRAHRDRRRRVGSVALVRRLERTLDRPFRAAANPLRCLGALGFLYLWATVASGAWIYALYDTGVDAAYRSVEGSARSPAALYGLVRSFHRYAADGFVLASLLHLLRELALGRFAGFRWYTWVTGVATLPLMIAVGAIGYWMVWDQLSAWIATATTAWFAVLPGFDPGLARNFSSPGAVSDRLFSLLVFLHIGLPLLLLLALWLHLLRLVRPHVIPVRRLGGASLAAIVVLGALAPATIAAPADVARLPQRLVIDGWFLLPQAASEAWGPGLAWLASLGLLALLFALPLSPWRPGGSIGSPGPGRATGVQS